MSFHARMVPASHIRRHSSAAIKTHSFRVHFNTLDGRQSNTVRLRSASVHLGRDRRTATTPPQTAWCPQKFGNIHNDLLLSHLCLISASLPLCETHAPSGTACDVLEHWAVWVHNGGYFCEIDCTKTATPVYTETQSWRQALRLSTHVRHASVADTHFLCTACLRQGSFWSPVRNTFATLYTWHDDSISHRSLYLWGNYFKILGPGTSVVWHPYLGAGPFH
jgi:hypothetical protein